jgi:hypothetical protein
MLVIISKEMWRQLRVWLLKETIKKKFNKGVKTTSRGKAVFNMGGVAKFRIQLRQVVLFDN